MLLASNEREATDLQERCRALRAAGQEAQLLDAREATEAELALRLPPDGAALLAPRDAQLVRRCGQDPSLLRSAKTLSCRRVVSR